MKHGLDYTVADHTRSKKQRLTGPLRVFRRTFKKWVSATHTYNYMLNDPLVDWLKLKRKRVRQVPKREGGFVQFIKNCGIEFENKLVKYIDENICPVKYGADRITSATCRKTVQMMNAGYPIIHSAPVRNVQKRTQGIIDLLVRSDIIGRLVDENPLTKAEQTLTAPNLHKPYHYLVIDAKFSTLPLRADGRHLLNSGRYPAYKAQTWIYNEAVGEIQGLTPQYAFILGRRYRYTKTDIVYRSNMCLDKLGVIDFKGVDSEYPELATKAIDWVRDVKKNGKNWTIDPPTRDELYPNMCNDAGEWQKEKESIAERLGEITHIWNVGLRHRNYALNSGIRSWRDPNCTTANINLRGVRAEAIDKILFINRQNEVKILPQHIKSNMYGWKKSTNEMFVDFETMSDIFSGFENIPEQNNTDMIFMIGVGWEEKGEWKYRSFVCDSATAEEEYRIMNEFYELVRERHFPRLNYWCAENRFWAKAENKQFDLAFAEADQERMDRIRNEWKDIDDWADLYVLFRSEPIVIKNCFNFGLKNVAKAMYGNGMIQTKLDSQCDSGMTAMVKAWQCYQNKEKPLETDVMKDIIKYNEFDCKVLWDIINYLRRNHL